MYYPERGRELCSVSYGIACCYEMGLEMYYPERGRQLFQHFVYSLDKWQEVYYPERGREQESFDLIVPEDR